MSDAAEILRKAKELIETKGWCRRDYAVGLDGEAISWSAPEACRFCMAGSLYAAAKTNHSPALSQAFDAIKQSNSIGDLVIFNDARGRRKPQILKAFDRAIALAEVKQP